MEVREVIFNRTGFSNVAVRDLAAVLKENPYDAHDIERAVAEGKKFETRDTKGWGYSVARA